MKRQLATLLLAALALTGCADTAAPASAPSTSPTATASPAPTVDDGSAKFLAELRRQARSLTPDVADDEALLTLGEMGCKSAGDEDLRQRYMLNATLTMGYTDGEARAAFQAAERHLC